MPTVLVLNKLDLVSEAQVQTVEAAYPRLRGKFLLFVGVIYNFGNFKWGDIAPRLRQKKTRLPTICHCSGTMCERPGR